MFLNNITDPSFKLAGGSDARAAVLKERSVNDGLGLNGPPNLEECMWLVGDWC